MTGPAPICPACGAASAFFAVVAEYDVWQCSDCGSDFVHPFPDPVALASVYDDASYFEGGPQQSGGYADYDEQTWTEWPWLVETVDAVEAAVRDRAGAVPRVLDVGCAYGTHLAMLAARGWETAGVEISAHARQTFATRHPGIAVYPALDEVPSGSFDLVLMLDVIEHLAKPRNTLMALGMRGHMGPRTVLLVATPNAGSLSAIEDGPDWAYLHPPTHLTLLTGTGLSRVLSSIGFPRVHVGGHSPRTSAGGNGGNSVDMGEAAKSYDVPPIYEGLFARATGWHGDGPTTQSRYGPHRALDDRMSDQSPCIESDEADSQEVRAGGRRPFSATRGYIIARSAAYANMGDAPMLADSGLLDPKIDGPALGVPDVSLEALAEHYLKDKKGMRTSAGFDPDFYLRSNPDVRDADFRPVVHFLRHGAAEQRPAFEGDDGKPTDGRDESPAAMFGVSGAQSEGFDRKISPTDTMVDGTASRYFEVGRSAMRAIDLVAPNITPATILDLPSGHGRVARHLRARWPDAEVYVADVDVVGRDFCVDTLGCHPLPTDTNFDNLDYGKKFDFIWVGSLVTHLRERDTKAFLRFIRRHLADHGSACVTSHGSFVAGRLMEAATHRMPIYGLAEEQVGALHTDYHRNGYGYAPYPHDEAYGISAAKRTWWLEAAREVDLLVNQHADHLWDDHQDVLRLMQRA